MRPIIDRFLCCIEIETGGLVIGWVGVIVICFIAVSRSLILLGSVSNCKRDQSCQNVFIYLFLNTTFCLGFFIAFVSLINGVHERKHEKIVPSTALLGTAAFASAVVFALSLENLDQEGMASSALSFAIFFHCFITTASIYIKFRSEMHVRVVRPAHLS